MVTARDVLRAQGQRVVQLSARLSVGEARDLVDAYAHHGFPVVSSDGRLCGVLYKWQLRALRPADTDIVGHVMDPHPIVFGAHQPMVRLRPPPFDILLAHHIRAAPVQLGGSSCQARVMPPSRGTFLDVPS